MKKAMLTAVMVFSACISGLADNGWGLHWSYWNPADGKAAYGPGAKLSLEIMANAQLDMRAGYFNKIEMRKQGLEADLEVIPLELGLSYAQTVHPMLDVFGGVGFGYYLMDGKMYDAQGQRFDVKPGDQIGYFANVGVEVALALEAASYGANRVALMFELLFRVVEANDLDLPTNTERFRSPSLGGPALNVGLMVRW